MRPVPIETARKIARDSGATRLLIIGIDDAENFTFTTYGSTRARCRALGKWADVNAPRIGLAMDRATDDDMTKKSDD